VCSADPADGREPVVFVEVRFPDSATYDPSTDDGVDRSQPIPTQRLGYCVQHAAEAKLDGPLVQAVAVKGLRAAGRFPAGHALADAWSWRVA
jgi:hypothetical protein